MFIYEQTHQDADFSDAWLEAGLDHALECSPKGMVPDYWNMFDGH